MEMSPLEISLEAYGADVEGTRNRFCGNEQLFKDCLRKFFSMREFQEMEQLIYNKKYEEAFISAHTLKGLSGNLGLTPLYTVICVLVESLRNENYKNIENQYSEVRNAILDARHSIEKFLD